jgi:thiamine pyrophosphokinase
MKGVIVQSTDGVTLAGGGVFSLKLLEVSLTFAPRLVAADGGATRLLRFSHEPEAVIGDLDSIDAKSTARLTGRLFPIPEQATTDFDKALRSIAAPFVLGLGFTGGRIDHELAALHSLTRHRDKPCLLLGSQDVTFLAPRALHLDLPIGSRLSLFPMGPVRGESRGLRWPIDGLEMAPTGQIGTSNEVTGPVHLRFDADAMLIILPRRAISAALRGLADARAG